MMNLAPIVLFVYNRPWHTRQTLNALQQNKLASESILYIFADGKKENSSIEDLNQIKETRKIIRAEKWCKEVIIIERDKNLGLADNIVYGVTEVINKHGKIIVLEDDIVTSLGFLKYMNEALEAYVNEDKIMHISGYFPNVSKKLPDFFFYNQTSCWGWATWKRAWQYYNGDTADLYNKLLNSNRQLEFNINNSYPFLSHLEANLNGEMKTWAIKWHTSVFLKKGLCLHPAKSFVENIGFDNSGVHCGVSNKFSINNLNNLNFRKPKKIKENEKARKAIEYFYNNYKKKPFFLRLKNKIKKVL